MNQQEYRINIYRVILMRGRGSHNITDGLSKSGDAFSLSWEKVCTKPRGYLSSLAFILKWFARAMNQGLLSCRTYICVWMCVYVYINIELIQMRYFIKYRSGLLLISYILIGIEPWISNYTHQHGIFVIKTWISNYTIVYMWCISQLMPEFQQWIIQSAVHIRDKIINHIPLFHMEATFYHAPTLLLVWVIFVSKMAPWLLPTSRPLFVSGWISIFILRNNLICMQLLCGPVTPYGDIDMDQHWSR